MKLLNTKFMHPRDQIVMVIDRVYKRGLTTTSGGNINSIILTQSPYLMAYAVSN
ncbi:hypothetical protein [Natronoflexus pectinivorans]|uniref:Uncharacterized protein n=1 Tax=Natronoflexus pectinivorans TaxID=682526 RepID=A0A4R2GH77_9BACT|nr:hypothetical protein [Natronoflexus pectinivorans]TCO07736.1 hypothetical protein EV194_107120 [Natronoflexus pectinivorans]